MTRRKKKISEMADDELPPLFFVDHIPGPDGPQIRMRMHPQFDEIIVEAKRRGLRYKDGRFYRPGEPQGNGR